MKRFDSNGDLFNKNEEKFMGVKYSVKSQNS
jgi:hypothetical protein